MVRGADADRPRVPSQIPRRGVRAPREDERERAGPDRRRRVAPRARRTRRPIEPPRSSRPAPAARGHAACAWLRTRGRWRRGRRDASPARRRCRSGRRSARHGGRRPPPPPNGPFERCHVERPSRDHDPVPAGEVVTHVDPLEPLVRRSLRHDSRAARLLDLDGHDPSWREPTDGLGEESLVDLDPAEHRERRAPPARRPGACRGPPRPRTADCRRRRPLARGGSAGRRFEEVPFEDGRPGDRGSRAFSRASSTASGDRSVANIVASGSSSCDRQRHRPGARWRRRPPTGRPPTRARPSPPRRGPRSRAAGRTRPGGPRTRMRRKPWSPVTCWSGSPTHRRQSARPKSFASCDVSPSPGVDARPIRPQDVRKEPLRGGNRALHAVPLQVLGRSANHLRRPHITPSCPAVAVRPRSVRPRVVRIGELGRSLRGL